MASITAPALAEQQRRQPHRGQRFLGAGGPLQPQSCRHQRASRQVRTKFVQSIDPLPLDRTAAILALDTEDDAIAGRHLQPGARRPAEAARAEVINLVNNFYYEKLTGFEKIKRYMDALYD